MNCPMKSQKTLRTKQEKNVRPESEKGQVVPVIFIEFKALLIEPVGQTFLVSAVPVFFIHAVHLPVHGYQFCLQPNDRVV